MQTKKKSPINSIFLADDDEDDRAMFKEVIQEVNPSIKLQVVTDGRELLALLENFVPDILFLDLDMPRKNGLECLVAIRQNERLMGLPVVMFSSTTRQVNIQTAYDMGAHLFLIKSSYYNEFITALKAILELDWKAPEKIKEQYCVNNRYAAFT